MAILRGEIYFVELGPTRGREIDSKRRPVLVVSADGINQKPLVVVVIPGGTKAPGKPVFQFEIKVEPTAGNGLKNATVFQCFQIKALDHSRFDSDPVGVIAQDDLARIEDAMKMCFQLS